MFDMLEQYHVNELHVRNDSASGLKAFVAIHNTSFGPALGGCRFIQYQNEEQALLDALKLAKSMSYKAVLAGIEQGGGKAVIMKPAGAFDPNALFQEFGRFVDSLDGRYITAIDSGTTAREMDIIETQTTYVTSTSNAGNPSSYTAQGVFEGIRAAVKHKLQRDDLEKLRVVIQGVGNVGFILGELLAQAGAYVIVSDINKAAVSKALDTFAEEAVDPHFAHKVPASVFAPCSLSGAINHDNLNDLECMIVAGSANVQLASRELGQRLHEKGILYAPDYVINSGGLIYASLNYQNKDLNTVKHKVSGIYNTLSDIFERSDHQSTATSEIADQMAESLLYAKLNDAA